MPVRPNSFDKHQVALVRRQPHWPTALLNWQLALLTVHIVIGALQDIVEVIIELPPPGGTDANTQ